MKSHVQFAGLNTLETLEGGNFRFIGIALWTTILKNGCSLELS